MPCLNGEALTFFEWFSPNGGSSCLNLNGLRWGIPERYGERIETAERAVRRHAIVALHGPCQPNVRIHSATARPISSGESS